MFERHLGPDPPSVPIRGIMVTYVIVAVGLLLAGKTWGGFLFVIWCLWGGVILTATGADLGAWWGGPIMIVISAALLFLILRGIAWVDRRMLGG